MSDEGAGGGLEREHFCQSGRGSLRWGGWATTGSGPSLRPRCGLAVTSGVTTAPFSLGVPDAVRRRPASPSTHPSRRRGGPLVPLLSFQTGRLLSLWVRPCRPWAARTTRCNVNSRPFGLSPDPVERTSWIRRKMGSRKSSIGPPHRVFGVRGPSRVHRRPSVRQGDGANGWAGGRSGTFGGLYARAPCGGFRRLGGLFLATVDGPIKRRSRTGISLVPRSVSSPASVRRAGRTLIVAWLRRGSSTCQESPKPL